MLIPGIPLLYSTRIPSPTKPPPHPTTHGDPTDSMSNAYNSSLSAGIVGGLQSRGSHSKSDQILNLGSFNVRTLTQAGQQACLALAMDLRVSDNYCISETNSGFQWRHSSNRAWSHQIISYTLEETRQFGLWVNMDQEWS